MRKKKKNYRTVKIILASIAALSIVLLAYFGLQSDSQQLVNDILDEGGFGSDVEDTPELTIVPSSITSDPDIIEGGTGIAGMPERKVQVYVDLNKNFQKDSNEDICNSCYGDKLSATEVLNGIFPSVGNIRRVGVNVDGIINANELSGTNTIWGYSESIEMLVGNFAFSLNDGSSDVLIPIWPMSLSLLGHNTNMSNAEGSSSGTGSTTTAIYSFETPIPVFVKAYSNGQRIWVQYYPDTAQTDKYYLADGLLQKDLDGTVTGSQGSYYLTVIWGLNGHPKLTEKENLRFILF